MYTTQLWEQGLRPFHTGLDGLERWDDIFRNYLSTRGSCNVDVFPELNIWTNEGFETEPKEAKVTVKLPGYSNEEIDVSVANNIVTIKGGHKVQEGQEGQEGQEDTFERSIEPPFSIDAAKVEAVYSKGILTLTLPIAEAQRPRKISLH